LGIQIESANQIQKMLGSLVQNLNQTNVVTMIVGISAMILILVSKKYLPKFPSALLVTVLGVIITQSIKRFKLKSFYGNTIVIGDKPKLLKSNLYRGIVFGLG
jgi:MFS superfamily sulfate permease-like transporter